MTVCAYNSVASVTTAETAISSIQPVPSANGSMRLNGILYFTGNAAASTLVITVRRGTGTTGTAVFTSGAISVAAAAVKAEPFDCVDTAPGVTETYTVTATFSGAPTGAVTGTIAAEVVNSLA